MELPKQIKRRAAERKVERDTPKPSPAHREKQKKKKKYQKNKKSVELCWLVDVCVCVCINRSKYCDSQSNQKIRQSLLMCVTFSWGGGGGGREINN